MNIVIPMAGLGKRFTDNGYDLPKPLIDVCGKPMVQQVIDNLYTPGATFTFILNREQPFDQSVITSMLPDANMLYVEELTDGPARTALIASDLITEENLIIINCDQIIRDFSIESLLEFVEYNGADGVLGAFISSSKKNSYMKLDPNGEVIDVKEKIVISNVATNGLHFWANGRDFVKSANEMIDAGVRYNNEFYIAPTYNYMVKDGKKVLPFFYNLHMPIGIPEDLEGYISWRSRVSKT